MICIPFNSNVYFRCTLEFLSSIFWPFLLLSLIFFSGCKDRSQKNNLNLKQARLEIIDSIILDGIYDYEYIDFNKNSSKLLLLDKKTYDLIQYNLYDERIQPIPLPGIMQNNSRFNFQAAGYFGHASEDSICVITHKGYYILDQDGMESNHYPLLRTKLFYSTTKASFLNIKNQSLILHSGGIHNYNRDNTIIFEKSRLFSLFNRNNGQIETLIPYEESNIIKETGEARNSINRYFVNDSYLYVQIDPDQHVYVYDCYNDFELIHTIELSLEHYVEVKRPRATFKDFLIESGIWSFFNDGERIFIQYKGYMEEEMIPNDVFSSADSKAHVAERMVSYLTIYKKFTKTHYDIVLPVRAGEILTHYKNNLFLASSKLHLVENNRGSVLYILALKEN